MFGLGNPSLNLSLSLSLSLKKCQFERSQEWFNEIFFSLHILYLLIDI